MIPSVLQAVGILVTAVGLWMVTPAAGVVAVGVGLLAFNTAVRKRMAAAVSSFYQAATSDGLTHDGHPGLSRHIDNAVLKETAQGAYIVKEDKASPRKIDAAIAAVIAFNRAAWHHQNPKVETKAGVFFT